MKFDSTKRLLSATVAVVALIPALSFGATHTVSDWSQLRSKMSSAANGDTIKVNAGTYQPGTVVANVQSTSARNGGKVHNVAPQFYCNGKTNLTIEAATSTKPVLKGTGWGDGKYVLYAKDCDGLKLRNLVFENAEKGVIIDSSNDIVIEDSIVQYIGAEGIHIRDDSSGARISNNTIKNTGLDRPPRGESIYVGSDKKMWHSNYDPEPLTNDTIFGEKCDNTIIEGNTIGPNIGAETDIKEGVTGTIVRNNKFYADINHSAILSHAENSRKNLLYDKGANSRFHDNEFYMAGAVWNAEDLANGKAIGAIEVGQVLDDNVDSDWNVYGHGGAYVHNDVYNDDSAERILFIRADGGNNSNTGCNTDDNGVDYFTGSKSGVDLDGTAPNDVISGSTCDNYLTSGSPPPTGGGSSTGSTSSSSGYTGSKNIPNKIQAQNYKAANDSTVGNAGGSPGCTYHGLDVDVQTTSDSSGSCNVGWTTAGEWVEYKVGTSTESTYDIKLRVASNSTGNRLQVYVNGSSVGTVTANNSGWSGWHEKTLSGKSIPSSATIKVKFLDGGVNLNYLDIVSAGGSSSSSSSSGGAPTAGTNNIQIRNAGSNRCLQANGVNNGDSVISAGCDSGTDQSIDVQAHTSTPYLKLKFDNNGLLMDGGTVAENQVAHMWSASNHSNRRLELIHNGSTSSGDPKFRIKNVTGNKCLRGDWNGAKWKTCSSSDTNQHWYVN